MEGAEYRLALSGRHAKANLISNIRPHDSNGHCFGLVGTAWNVVLTDSPSLKNKSEPNVPDVSTIKKANI